MTKRDSHPRPLPLWVTGQDEPSPQIRNKVKKIAVIGLPFLEQIRSPMKAALQDCLQLFPKWEIVLMSGPQPASFDFVRSIECDGVLARVISPQAAKRAQRLTFPVVNISGMMKDPGVPSVLRDHFEVGKMCARHCLDRGFTSYAFLTWLDGKAPAHYDSLCRGFEWEWAGEGKKKKPPYFSMPPLSKDAASLRRLRKWLSVLPKPCVLFLPDDLYTAVLFQLSGELSLRIPEDLAVIVGSAHPDILEQCPVSLTHPLMEGSWFMKTAVYYLAWLMENPGLPASTISLLPPYLVKGESTNIHTSDDPLVASALTIMRTDFKTNFHVPDLMTRLHCSRRTLESRFKKVFKKSIGFHLTEMRVQEAARQLRAEPGIKIEVLARECGFAQSKSFRRVFREHFGQPPSKWVVQEQKANSRGRNQAGAGE